MPEASTFTVDANGYRIYTPIDIPTANKKAVTNTTYLWSRFVDFHNQEKWSTLAFVKTGGAFRHFDENGLPIYAAFDLRLINQWQFVPADYDHNILINGNALEELSLEEFFDVARITAKVSPRINSADSLQTVVIESNVISNSLDYGGKLHYDENSIYSGTEHPVGTSVQKVNNIEDGIAIALENGLTEIHVYSNVNMDRDVEGVTIIGGLPNLIMYTHGFKMHLCKFNNLKILGDFNNSLVKIVECNVLEALNVYGVIDNSYHSGRIKIAAGYNLNMADCESGIPGQNSPEIDMNEGNDTTFSSRGFSGGQTITYCDTPDCVATLSFVGGGKPHLEPSNTDGHLSVRGSGQLDDRSGIGCEVETGAWIEAGYIGVGTNVWTEEEKLENLAYSRKASDNAEQANLKL